MPKPLRCKYCGKRFEQTRTGRQIKKKFCCDAHRYAFNQKDGIRLIEVRRIMKQLLPGMIDERIERALKKLMPPIVQGFAPGLPRPTPGSAIRG